MRLPKVIATLLSYMGILEAVSPTHANARQKRLLRHRLLRDDVAITEIATTALIVAGVVIAAVVVMLILASLTGTYSGAVKNVSVNVSTSDWGHPVANAIASPFGMLISIGGLAALVGLVFLAYHFRPKRGV